MAPCMVGTGIGSITCPSCLSASNVDIGLVQEIHRGRLLSPERIDHGDWILPKLAEIGFDFERRGDIVRIWGYLPRCTLDFPPAKS